MQPLPPPNIFFLNEKNHATSQKKELKKRIMQHLHNCIGPTIRIGREIQCLPYAGFFSGKEPFSIV